MKQRVVFAFGPWRLDPVAKVLFRDGEPVHMTRKAVETLLVLVANPGRVLTKEEIMTAVWTDRVVDEANLAQNIAVVRRILAAEKGSPAHIETFPGRGYRLEGPVITETDVRPVAEIVDVPERPAARPPAPAPLPAPEQPRVAAPDRRRWLVGVLLIVAGISFGVYRRASSSSPASPADVPVISHVTPITRMAGKEYQIAIARDGQRIAFVWAEDGSTPPQVWVQNTNGGNARPLSRGGHHSSPVWAPDGSRLAFLRIERDGTQLVIAAADGSSERVLTKFEQAAYGLDHRLLDWSPDGRQLVLSRPVTGKSTLALHSVDPANGSSRLLTDTGGAMGDVDPRFSPDGAQVSFLRLIVRTRQEIFSVPASGGAAVQVTKVGRRISSHDWTRDGSAVVYASDRDGNFRLWRLKVPSKDGGGSATPLGIYSEFPIQLAAARGADSLVYSALQQDRNIWRLSLRTLEWKRLIASSGQDASPQYSPDGEWICFRSDRSGEDQLWVTRADGSGAAQITRGSLRPSVGRWSPDGSSIVFNSPETSEIWMARQTAGEWSVRNTGVQGVHPVFSPDGRWIYAGGPSGIHRFSPAGPPVETVSTTRSEALAVSGDGRHLYFAREPGDTTLWRLDLGRVATEKVLDGLVAGCTSCWSLDPNGIYFLGTDQESFDRQVLYFYDFKTSATKAVLPYPEPLWPLGSGPFSLGPGGNLLVVRVEPSNSDAMLVAPFR